MKSLISVIVGGALLGTASVSTGADFLGCGCITVSNLDAAKEDCELVVKGAGYPAARVRPARAEDYADNAPSTTYFNGCPYYINFTPACIVEAQEQPVGAMICEGQGGNIIN